MISQFEGNDVLVSKVINYDFHDKGAQTCQDTYY